MTKDEALKLTIQVLEERAGTWGSGHRELKAKAIAAAKEALAQPEQEDDYWYFRYHETLNKLNAVLAQPEQEPVAWTLGPNLFKDWCAVWFGPDSDDDYLAKAVFDLPPMAQKFAYTSPPQRQPLTDEKIEAIGDEVANATLVGTVSNFQVRLARAIEAAHNIKEIK